MASFTFRGRRARSASISSDSSFGVGGGAPLDSGLGDLTTGDNPTHHQRSVSEMLTARGRSMTRSISTASSDGGGYVGSTRDASLQRFQIGKPPRDDEEVFNNSPSTSKKDLTAPVPIIKQDEKSQAIVPIHAQPTPAERRHLVQGVDAQTYYPAEACIFVANLPESKSDTALEVAITKAFANFGPVFVKIRRDPKNMPFAFCQYTDALHAQRAQREGKGVLVEGRPCRTEMVKANRCFVMFHRKGKQVDLAEARSHLLQFGDVSKLELLHEDAIETMKLPGALFVEYKRFDPSRDIISAFRYHEEYGVVAYDLKKVNPNQVNHYASYLARYEVDRRSIYVGNLPHNVENIEEVLRHAASVAGTVEGVQIIRKDPRNEGGRPTVFAFVEYARPDEALSAVERLRGTMLVNNRIRVEKKKCPEQSTSHTRGETSASTSSAVKETSDTPTTPARPIVASGADRGPDSVYAQRRLAATPAANRRSRIYGEEPVYNQANTYTSPYTSPYGQEQCGQSQYGQAQYSQAQYGQAQYVSPQQAYQQGQYVSPNYALSPGYQQHYGHGVYNPATPQIPGAGNTPYHHGGPSAQTPYHGSAQAQTPYQGSASGYYQTSPYWPTPYLQDQNDGYNYYAGYGQQQHYTPSGAATRPGMYAERTPSRHVEQGAEQHKPGTIVQAGVKQHVETAEQSGAQQNVDTTKEAGKYDDVKPSKEN